MSDPVSSGASWGPRISNEEPLRIERRHLVVRGDEVTPGDEVGAGARIRELGKFTAFVALRVTTANGPTVGRRPSGPRPRGGCQVDAAVLPGVDGAEEPFVAAGAVRAVDA